MRSWVSVCHVAWLLILACRDNSLITATSCEAAQASSAGQVASIQAMPGHLLLLVLLLRIFHVCHVAVRPQGPLQDAGPVVDYHGACTIKRGRWVLGGYLLAESAVLRLQAVKTVISKRAAERRTRFAFREHDSVADVQTSSPRAALRNGPASRQLLKQWMRRILYGTHGRAACMQPAQCR